MKLPLILFYIFPFLLFSQDNYCSYNTNRLKPNYYVYLQGNYTNNPKIDKIITDITSQIGLDKNFVYVASPGLENCVALNYDGFRYILYDENFLNQLTSNNVQKTSVYVSVLSHEIGHHLEGHTLKNISEKDNKLGELEADKFSGYIMAKLGFSLFEAQEAMKTIPNTSSNSHPQKVERLNAIKIGYNTASLQIKKEVSAIEDNLFIKFFMQGQENLRSEKYEEAAENFTTAMALNKKNNFFPLSLRAIAYSKNKYFKQAISDYEKMENIHMPDSAVLGNYLFFNRGVTYEDMDEFKLASRNFLKANEFNPKDKVALMKFAVSQSLAGNYTSALLAFEYQISDKEINESKIKNFTKGDIFLQKGISYLNVNELENAIKYFDLAKNQYPEEYTKLALPDFYKGQSYSKLKQYNNAIKSYKSFLDIYKKEQDYFVFDINYNKANEVLYNLAKIYQEKKDFILSNEYITKILKREPKNANAYYLKGYNLYYENNITQAVSNFKKSCDLGLTSGCKVITELNKNNKLESHNELPISGGYTTKKILEYKYNKNTDTYELEDEFNINSQLYFADNFYAFKRGQSKWLSANWKYKGYDQETRRYLFYDNYGQNIAFDNDLKTITWFTERSDNQFQKIIVYKILNPNNSVHPQ